MAETVAVICEDPSLRGRLHACLATADLASSADGVAVLGGGPREVLAELNTPRDSVVAVVPDPDPPVLRRLLRAGAHGIVAAQHLETMLAPAVTAVAAGFICVPPKLRRQLHKPALSMREKQVLGLVVMGLSNSEIAAKLHVAPATVKSHLTSSFEKLGVRSRAQATDMLLDPESGLGLGILSLSSEGRGRPAEPGSD